MIEGNIGSSIKMDYTVLGDTVNQAMQLGVFARDVNKVIMISESIRILAASSWEFEAAGEIEFKGSKKPSPVSALLDFSNCSKGDGL
jgi:class 3 adenylate cyclase